MIKLTENQMATVFTEWLRRYQEEPEKFIAEYGEPGNYGKDSTEYFCNLMDELFE